MIMQDRAKRTMFYHVLDKGSMVANPFFFGNSFLILSIFIALVSIAFSNFQ